MSDYKKSETRQILEEIYSGKYPVRGSDGREYYVRYNDNREELEEVPPPELRPLTEKDKAKALRLASGLRPQGFGAWEIAGEGLKGFGQGVVSGLGRVSGGATGSDSMDELPENVAWGAALGAALPFGVHYGAKGAKWAARPVTEKATRYLGKRKLAKQLAKGSDFEDVNLGYIDDQLATRLNQVRNAENVSPVESARVVIPRNSIEHIYQRRIADNKYTPDDMAGVVENALFGKNIHVVKGNLPQYQIIYDSSNPANKVVVGKHRDTGDVFIKTAMKDSGLSKKNKTLDGRTFPSFAVDSTITGNSNIPSPQHVRFSVFQGLNKSIIPQNMSAVNPAFKRSFVEALADENKRRTMRNAVMSGAEDLSERAKILSDRLERRNGGMYDADFEQVIKTPELSRAEEKYTDFMAKNGGQMMPEEKAADFYAQHPIAEDMIAEMRLIDPRAFDGIQPGSLAEFDMLKKRLREEAGNKVKVGVSRSGALKRAENDLKTLMDREFPGFRDVNRNFADARTTQDIFESRLKKGLMSVGGATVSPYWSGLLMSGMRRNAGRRLADGIVQTPIEVNINPLLSAGFRPQGFGALDVAKEGLKGFGQGVVSGLGRVAGGATLGATDWLDRKTGGHLASLDADLQRSAEGAGLGGWNKAAKFASELGGNMLFGGIAGKTAFETARPIR